MNLDELKDEIIRHPRDARLKKKYIEQAVSEQNDEHFRLSLPYITPFFDEIRLENKEICQKIPLSFCRSLIEWFKARDDGLGVILNILATRPDLGQSLEATCFDLIMERMGHVESFKVSLVHLKDIGSIHLFLNRPWPVECLKNMSDKGLLPLDMLLFHPSHFENIRASYPLFPIDQEKKIHEHALHFVTRWMLPLKACS